MPVYLLKAATTRVTLPWDSGDSNALLMDALSPLSKHHTLVVHAPRPK